MARSFSAMDGSTRKDGAMSGEVEALKWLLIQRESSEVDRAHTVRIHRRYTVGQHSYNVAMLVLYFGLHPTSLMDEQFVKDVALRALMHDIAEVGVGDIPAPVKWSSEVLKSEIDRLESIWVDEYVPPHLRCFMRDFSPSCRTFIKVCDYLELVLYCNEEIMMGSTAPSMHSMRRAALDYLLSDEVIGAAEKSSPALSMFIRSL